MTRALDSGLVQIQDDIRSDFGWRMQDDLDSARDLLWYCESKSRGCSSWSANGRLNTLLKLQEELISGPLTVLGAAAEPADVRDAIVEGHRLIAADGAVGVLNESEYPGIAWDALLCVVSDGDGDMSDLMMAAKRGIPFVLHAHGDNVKQWIELLDILFLHNTPIVLTHQTPSRLDGMYNPGGFTDGDRAVCFALSQNVASHMIRLRGFKTDSIGRWTGQTNPERKMRKLEWMSRVLNIAGVSM
ncbi:MAG: hypothetical protein VYA86_07400 [Candidatus Thermoplasmatota archaeon]|nr:hypothetical protein [Candidatus Thermoplasmatota archaeon]